MSFLYTKLIKNILFLLDAESAHCFSLGLLNFLNKLGMLNYLFKKPKLEYSQGLELSNLKFKNKLGIAPGLDKNGDYIEALAKLGVGFIELGTVTPRPQGGNPKPRLFRVSKSQAIINRMGFNNIGVDGLISNIKSYKKSKYYLNNYLSNKTPLLGINIGKNLDTSLDKAVIDYITCLIKAYEYADYFTVNISSPNTKNLRDLQKEGYLENFLAEVITAHNNLAQKHHIYKPIALKISPDLSNHELHNICDLCCKYKIDILIISNTTVNHELLLDKYGEKISGGLSGKPLFELSNIALKQAVDYLKSNNCKKISKHHLSIIGVGGISSFKDAKIKLELGSDLVQVYSGLVYKGPGLINKIIDNI